MNELDKIITPLAIVCGICLMIGLFIVVARQVKNERRLRRLYRREYPSAKALLALFSSGISLDPKEVTRLVLKEMDLAESEEDIRFIKYLIQQDLETLLEEKSLGLKYLFSLPQT